MSSIIFRITPSALNITTRSFQIVFRLYASANNVLTSPRANRSNLECMDFFPHKIVPSSSWRNFIWPQYQGQGQDTSSRIVRRWNEMRLTQNISHALDKVNVCWQRHNVMALCIWLKPNIFEGKKTPYEFHQLVGCRMLRALWHLGEILDHDDPGLWCARNENCRWQRLIRETVKTTLNIFEGIFFCSPLVTLLTRASLATFSKFYAR